MTGTDSHGPVAAGPIKQSHPRSWFITRAIAPLHGYGGLERSSGDLVRALRDLGTDVRVITRPPYPTDDEDAARSNGFITVDWPRVPRYQSIEMSLGYARWCNYVAGYLSSRVAPGDVVHANGGAAAVLARLDQAGATLILNPHGMEEFFAADARARVSGAWLRHAVRKGAQIADYVIATDEGMQVALMHHLHVDPERIRVVPNGVDVDRLRRLAVLGAEQLPDLGLQRDAPLLVTVGRLAWNKGYDLIPGVLELLQRTDGPDPYWWHVGSGDLGDSIREKLEERGLSDRVRLFPGRDDAFTQAAIAKADVFCQPSRYEGSSLTTLEALSHGRPVVATAVGGIPDKIRNERTGLLAEPTPTSLASAIERMLTDRRLALRCGENGQELVRNEFSIKAAARSYEKLYEVRKRNA